MMYTEQHKLCAELNGGSCVCAQLNITDKKLSATSMTEAMQRVIKINPPTDYLPQILHLATDDNEYNIHKLMRTDIVQSVINAYVKRTTLLRYPKYIELNPSILCTFIKDVHKFNNIYFVRGSTQMKIVYSDFYQSRDINNPGPNEAEDSIGFGYFFKNGALLNNICVVHSSFYFRKTS